MHFWPAAGCWLLAVYLHDVIMAWTVYSDQLIDPHINLNRVSASVSTLLNLLEQAFLCLHNGPLPRNNTELTRFAVIVMLNT